VREIRAQGDYAILLPLQTGFVQMSQLLRGFRKWYSDIALNPDLICFLMDQIMEVEMAIAGNLLDEVGDLVDVVMHFDDLAIQDRTIVSPAMYRNLIEPRMRTFYEFLHSRTNAKLIHHSDGAIAPFLESLIDIGIDGLNPLQISAKGMDDIRSLKEKFGSRISFWGGVDTQSILPFGSQGEVQEHIQWLVDELNRDGGYVLCSCHNILQDVPCENIITTYETALNHQIKL
jgi:uroporphyrinogen decarboxylase